MKNICKFTALMLCLMTMSLTACGDDDEDILSEAPGSEETTNPGGGDSDAGDTAVNKEKAVDLGLSVKWATCNVGASSPEEQGDYFAWGETTTKSSYTESNYFDSSYYMYTLSKKTNISGTNKDVAYLKLGNDWRMPTATEIKELVDNCTWTKETLNGVVGVRVTASNGNSIFLPATGMYAGNKIEVGSWGYYWSGTLYSDAQRTSKYAGHLIFYQDGRAASTNYYRFEGMAIRPVYTGDKYGSGTSSGGGSSSKYYTHCAGSGDCSRCGGDGYVLGDIDQEFRPCSSCNYGGKADDDERGKCTYCNGTGKK